MASASLDCPGLFSGVGYVVVKRSQEECSKSTPGRGGPVQSILLEQVLKEALG